MIFRSGQKFDMLGSDAYYGSPFYVLNNGDAKWNTISQMTQQEKYLADSLSTQWFASISQFAPSSVDQYRKLIFDNSKQISDGVKQKLSKETTEGVIPISQDNLAAFIDVRVHNNEEFISAMMKHLEKHKVKAHSKESFGFVYCNIDPISRGVVRVTPGINSEENQVIINFLNEWFASRKLTEPATPSS